MGATDGLVSGGRVSRGVGGTGVEVAAWVEAVVTAVVTMGAAEVAAPVGVRVVVAAVSPQAASSRLLNIISDIALKMRRFFKKFVLQNTSKFLW